MASVTPAARQDPTQLRPAPGKVSRLRWLGTRGRDAVRPTTAVELESMTSGGDAVPEGSHNLTVLRRDALYRRMLAGADMLSVVSAVLLAVALSGGEAPSLGWLLLAPLVVVLAKLAGLYDRDQHLLRKTTLEEVPTILWLATIIAFVIWFAAGASADLPGGRLEIVAVWGLLFLLIVTGRAIVRSVARRFVPVERCLIVGDEESARAMQRRFGHSFSLKATVVGRVPLESESERYRASATNGGLSPADPDLAFQSNGHASRRLSAPPELGTLEMLGLVLMEHDVHRVIIVPETPETDQTLHAIRVVKSLGVKVSVLPRMFEVVGSSVDFDDVDGVMLLSLHRSRLTRSSGMVKRGMDVVGALVASVALAPLLVAIAVGIKLTSPGPVLFRQKRVGRDGIEFALLKFRSMRDGADAEKEQLLPLNETLGLFKLSNDPRVTRIGRFLRRTSLDELPQLWNVLRGEMSLVGPRPLVPEEDLRIQGWKRGRLAVKPGMTGVWQILGSTRVPMEDMVKIDYLYGANWSLWTDIKILLRTAAYVGGARSS